ncbi:cellulase family glycosylhydrolase [Halomontanus rarus]|uniref:cellulase family glycosylhydrolase n=1 Tax=Halomontanus rarus TaxID=3034020 RepID=UPI0023E78971|nr:cellulase family glycosylhydrolase [Halovivax sp. TS33]
MVDDSDSHGSGRSERPPSHGHDLSRRRVLQATGLAVGGLALTGLTGSASAVGGPTPRLHTEGRWIRDPDGNDFTPRGVATASLDFLAEHHPRTRTEILEHATDGEDWYPNTVRLPVTEHAVVDDGVDAIIDNLLRPAVDLLADRGVYAVIDFHMIRPYADAAGCAEDMVADGWADSTDDLGFEADVGTDEIVTEFWSAVAPEFADDEHVLFELFNEPTVPVTWGQYGEYGDQVESREDSWLLWRDVAQPWVDLVRSHAPETPIIIGSPDWTSETQFAPQHPFEGENLIYSGHIYPDNGSPDEFDPEYGVPAEDVPVIITEFGWDPDEEFQETVEYGTTSEWGEPFREWAESYDNMGWLAWCFDDSWAPTFFDSPDEGAGEPWTLKDDYDQEGWYIRQWLEEAANGGSDGGSGGDGSDDGDGGDDSGGDDGGSGGDGNFVAEIDASTTEASTGESITFEVEDTSGDGTWIDSLEWDFGDGTTAGGWWTQHAYDTAGSYTVGLTATNNEGTATTHEVEITVS